MLHTMQAAINANQTAGFHFFDADTLRFFSSRLPKRVYPVSNGCLFVTSEQNRIMGDTPEPRRFTVRFIADNGRTETVGCFQAWGTRAAADRMARKLQGVWTDDTRIAKLTNQNDGTLSVVIIGRVSFVAGPDGMTHVDDGSQFVVLDPVDLTGNPFYVDVARLSDAFDPATSERVDLDLDVDAVLDARIDAAGAAAGRNAVEWWVQHVLGSTSATYGSAQYVLDGIDAGDPLILDGLPVLDLSGEMADGVTEADVLSDVDLDADDLSPEAVSDVLDRFRDAFDGAVVEAVESACRALLSDN